MTFDPLNPKMMGFKIISRRSQVKIANSPSQSPHHFGQEFAVIFFDIFVANKIGLFTGKATCKTVCQQAL